MTETCPTTYVKDLPWRPNAVRLAAQIDASGDSFMGPFLFRLYRIRRMRSLAKRLCQKAEGRLMFSQTWRRILSHYHRVDVGAYSYGDILTPRVLPPGTKVGRYCSVGKGLIVRRRDHPVEQVIMHPAFYNHHIGLLMRDATHTSIDNPLNIGNGVWIGDRVTILSGCKTIGNGAVIAAGSVVTRNVPAYAVVGGVPARHMRMRFDEGQIAEIEASAWWEHSLPELIADRSV